MQKIKTETMWSSNCTIVTAITSKSKINESLYIALFLVSGSIKKLSSIDCVNIYFSQSIDNYVF